MLEEEAVLDIGDLYSRDTTLDQQCCDCRLVFPECAWSS
jgi:hypothetical protein